MQTASATGGGKKAKGGKVAAMAKARAAKASAKALTPPAATEPAATQPPLTATPLAEPATKKMGEIGKIAAAYEPYIGGFPETKGQLVVYGYIEFELTFEDVAERVAAAEGGKGKPADLIATLETRRQVMNIVKRDLTEYGRDRISMETRLSIEERRDWIAPVLAHIKVLWNQK